MRNDEDFKLYFQVRGIDIKDVDRFFHMLCGSECKDDTEGIDVEVFVCSCMRLKGWATSLDLHSLSFETNRIMSLLQKFVKLTSDHIETIERNQQELNKTFRQCMTPRSAATRTPKTIGRFDRDGPDDTNSWNRTEPKGVNSDNAVMRSFCL